VDGSGNPTAFVLLTNGSLYEHVGTNPNTGWVGLTNGVSNSSASPSAADTVFFITSAGALYEQQGTNYSTGWTGYTTGVSQVASS
jgi:hypothetical protein